MFPDETPEVLGQRLEYCLKLCELNLELAREGVKLDYPNASEDEVTHLLKKRLDIYRMEKWKGYGLLPQTESQSDSVTASGQ